MPGGFCEKGLAQADPDPTEHEKDWAELAHLRGEVARLERENERLTADLYEVGGECCKGSDPHCAGGCLVETSARQRADERARLAQERDQEKERADSNFASYERVKGVFRRALCEVFQAAMDHTWEEGDDPRLVDAAESLAALTPPSAAGEGENS